MDRHPVDRRRDQFGELVPDIGLCGIAAQITAPGSEPTCEAPAGPPTTL